MNRCIIYRVWNGKEFFYYDYIPTLGFVIRNSGNSIEIGEFYAEQYTGLKDKNGKEIYEGDILKCKGYDDWFDKDGFYYLKAVEYEMLPSGESTLAGYLYIPKDIEVVGNIHENPELVPIKS